MCEVRIGLVARTLLLRVLGLRGLVPVFFFLACTGASAMPTCVLDTVAAAAGRGQWQIPAVTAGTAADGHSLQWIGDDGTRCRLPLPPHWAQQRISAVALSAPPHPIVLALATTAPNTIHFLDARLQPLHVVPVRDRGGRAGSVVCALRVLAQRESFVALFSHMPEVWELSYRPTAPEIGTGMVHDFQYREGQFISGYLNPMRSSLPFAVARFALDDSGHALTVYPRDSSTAVPVLLHLDVRRPIAQTPPIAPAPQDCVQP